jgi:hypothetical protein
MNRIFHWLAALAIFQACSTQSVYAEETNAVLPYKKLDEQCQLVGGVDPAKLDVRVFISSSNKAVHPADISLTIQSAIKGKIPVQIGTNGQVLRFPHEKELLLENPSIIAKQPKGTLNLVITMQLPQSDELTFRYSRLGNGVAELNKVIKMQAGWLSMFAPKAQDVIFFFPKASAGKAKVEVMSASHKSEYTADGNGQIRFKLEKKLLVENPEVKASEKPQQVMPVVPDME